MANMEFPNRNINQNDQYSVSKNNLISYMNGELDISNASIMELSALISMAYVVAEEKLEKKKEERFQKLVSTLDKVNKNISSSIDKVGENTNDIVEDITSKVFGSGLFVRKVKEGTIGIIKGFKNITFNSIGKLIKFMSLDAKTRNYKIAKMIINFKHSIKKIGNFFKTLKDSIIGIPKSISKTFKKLYNGLKWIGGMFKKFISKDIIMKLLNALPGLLKLLAAGGILSIGAKIVNNIGDKPLGKVLYDEEIKKFESKINSGDFDAKYLSKMYDYLLKNNKLIDEQRNKIIDLINKSYEINPEEYTKFYNKTGKKIEKEKKDEEKKQFIKKEAEEKGFWGIMGAIKNNKSNNNKSNDNTTTNIVNNNIQNNSSNSNNPKNSNKNNKEDLKNKSKLGNSSGETQI